MSLPKISHVQFAILAALIGGPMTGRELRKVLKEEGALRSGPAFYQLMARMEGGKLVKGTDERVEIKGYPVTQKRYRVLAGGRSAFSGTLAFINRRVGGLRLAGI